MKVSMKHNYVQKRKKKGNYSWWRVNVEPCGVSKTAGLPSPPQGMMQLPPLIGATTARHKMKCHSVGTKGTMFECPTPVLTDYD